MKTVGKIFLGIIFTFLLIIFVLLATIKFELLNKSFLFAAFEKHNTYAQLSPLIADYLQNTSNFSDEEKTAYAEFVKNIPPQDVKSLIENNLSQAIDFLNGQSQNIILSFSLPGVGFENASGIHWSLSQLPDKNLREKINSLDETGNILIIAGVVVLTILIGIIILYGRGILLTGGIFVVIVSLIGKLTFIIIGNDLMNKQELGQKMLGLLSSSLSPDITTSWLIVGGTLILLWFIFHISTKKHEKFLEQS